MRRTEIRQERQGGVQKEVKGERKTEKRGEGH